jgi:hypothetical protein
VTKLQFVQRSILAHHDAGSLLGSASSHSVRFQPFRPWT